MNDMTFSLILPVHNAATHLARVVEEGMLVVSHHFADYEIIIVNDGSSDATRLMAEHLAATHDPVMVLSHAHPQGYGCALLRGLRAARGDTILMLDSTRQISVSEISHMLHYADKYDLLTGYCKPLHIPWSWHIRDTFLKRLVLRFLAVDLHDIDYGMLLASADLLRALALQASTWLIKAEMYARARQHDVHTIQVGLHHDPRFEDVQHTTKQYMTLHSVRELFQLRSALHQSARLRRTQWQRKAMVGIGTITATHDR